MEFGGLIAVLIAVDAEDVVGSNLPEPSGGRAIASAKPAMDM
jgi:hypothetical protein